MVDRQKSLHRKVINPKEKKKIKYKKIYITKQ